MITKELTDYVDSQRALGKSDEEIRVLLVGNGWNPSDLNELFVQQKKGVHIPTLVIVVAVLVCIIASVLLYLNKSLFVSEDSVAPVITKQDSAPVGSSVKAALKTFNSSRLPFQSNLYSFSYPMQWTVFSDDSNNIYFARDRVMPEESVHEAIVSKKKPYIVVRQTTDSRATSTYAGFAGTTTENVHIGDKTVFGFSMKHPEDSSLTITGYVIAPTPQQNNGAIFTLASVTPTPEPEDLVALETMVSSYAVSSQMPLPGNGVLKDSDFLKKESEMYDEYKKSGTAISVAWDCAVNEYLKLLPQTIKDSKAKGSDIYQKVALGCLNKGLLSERNYSVSLAQGIADLNADMMKIHKDEQPNAFALIGLWSQILEAVNKNLIKELKKNIVIIAAAADPAAIAKMRDTFYTQQLQFGNDTAQYFNQRENILKKIAGGSAGNVVDIKMGTGDALVYGDIATVIIRTAQYEGKEYVADMTQKQGLVEVPVNSPSGEFAPLSYEGYKLGLLGMKIGGVRDITFAPQQGFYITPSVSVGVNKNIVFRVELVSARKPEKGAINNELRRSPEFILSK